MNSLQDAASSLQESLLRMSAVVGTREPQIFDSAVLESKSSRMECRAIRIELEHHRAEQHRQ
jgi:hypothetical protein